MGSQSMALKKKKIKEISGKKKGDLKQFSRNK